MRVRHWLSPRSDIELSRLVPPVNRGVGMERSTAFTASEGDTSERPGRTERKRRAILQKAEALFLDRGFVGASVEEVAARAAVSKQTVYKQFESKAALFVAVVQGMTGQASD